MPPIDLRGLPIAITGASSGIGLAAAFACARAGMPVAIGARRLDKLQAAAERINAEGGRAVAIRCDVAEQASCESFIDLATQALGSLHAVFANAGYGMEAPTLAMSDAEIEAMFRTNMWGTLWTIRPALARMIPAGRGHVLVCSSCLSKLGTPYHAAYSATKAAQDHFARALRIELAGTGVHVSSVHPIGTSSEFFDTAAARSPGYQGLAPRTADRLMQSPDRVASAIVRCLRRPRGEVWTSTPTRLSLALATAFPALADRVLRRETRARCARRGPSDPGATT